LSRHPSIFTTKDNLLLSVACRACSQSRHPSIFTRKDHLHHHHLLLLLRGHAKEG